MAKEQFSSAIPMAYMGRCSVLTKRPAQSCLRAHQVGGSAQARGPQGEDRTGSAPASDERVSVEQFINQWFENAKPNLGPSTVRTYKSLLNTHIKPGLGSRRLVRLSPSMLEQFFANRLAEGLSPKSIALVRGILTRAFGDAVRDGYLTRNPASLATAPKVAGRRDEAITPVEAHAIVQAFDGHPLSTLVAVALGSGLRQGELLALRWEDIDLDKGTVREGATLQRVKGEYLRLEPKTERSRRTVPLADFAAQALANKPRIRRLGACSTTHEATL
jgi:integrase